MLANLLLLAAVSLAWAAGYLFVGAADQGAPPITATAAMSLVAAAVMLPGVRLLRRPWLQPLRRRPWVPLVMAVTAVALPNLSVVYAERSVHPDQAAVLGCTVPIATLLLSAFLTRETRLSAGRAAGVLLALVGLVIFVGTRNLVQVAEVEGLLAMASGGVVFAVNGLFVGRQTKDLDDTALAAWTLAFSVPLLAVAAFVFEEPWTLEPSAPIIRAVVAEGLLGLAFAYLGYYVLVSRAGAWFASLYAFLVPPLGVLLLAAVAGRAPTASHLVGVTVVLAGLWLIQRDET
jgi:drug/metabolite transporter (DMT)-like permease